MKNKKKIVAPKLARDPAPNDAGNSSILPMPESKPKPKEEAPKENKVKKFFRERLESDFPMLGSAGETSRKPAEATVSFPKETKLERAKVGVKAFGNLYDQTAEGQRIKKAGEYRPGEKFIGEMPKRYDYRKIRAKRK